MATLCCMWMFRWGSLSTTHVRMGGVFTSNKGESIFFQGLSNMILIAISMRRSVQVNLTLEDFQKVSDEVPLLADLKPSGKYVMEDIHKVKL